MNVHVYLLGSLAARPSLNHSSVIQLYKGACIYTAANPPLKKIGIFFGQKKRADPQSPLLERQL